ncbi:MAG: hypothetical protein JRI67_08365 [Deltaproteobacteria bacterium]|nr:hypothetical protein [Deltaproteobacteria bacterium]
MENFIKMIKRLGKIGIGIIIFITIYLVYDDIRIASENNKNINKEIYSAFRKVEQYCMSYNEVDIPKKCELVLQLCETCSDARRECFAEDYYEALQRFGFDMPPYYKPGFNKKYPIWKFWKK